MNDRDNLQEAPNPGEDAPGFTINRYNWRTRCWCWYADDQSIRRIFGEMSWYVETLELMETEDITWLHCRRRDGHQSIEYQFIRNRRPRELMTLDEYTPYSHNSGS